LIGDERNKPMTSSCRHTKNRRKENRSTQAKQITKGSDRQTDKQINQRKEAKQK
jgi:hypothetical protein